MLLVTMSLSHASVLCANPKANLISCCWWLSLVWHFGYSINYGVVNRAYPTKNSGSLQWSTLGHPQLSEYLLQGLLLVLPLLSTRQHEPANCEHLGDWDDDGRPCMPMRSKSGSSQTVTPWRAICHPRSWLITHSGQLKTELVKLCWLLKQGLPSIACTSMSRVWWSFHHFDSTLCDKYMAFLVIINSQDQVAHNGIHQLCHVSPHCASSSSTSIYIHGPHSYGSG